MWLTDEYATSRLKSVCASAANAPKTMAEGTDSAGGFLIHPQWMADILPLLRAHAVPVGGIISDYQGLICRPGFTCDPRQLLKACKLVSWVVDVIVCSGLPPFTVIITRWIR